MVAFSPFRQAIFLMDGRRVQLYEAARTRTLELDEPVSALCPVVDGALFATFGSGTSTLHRFSYESAGSVVISRLEHEVVQLAANPNGTTVIAVDKEAAVRIRIGHQDRVDLALPVAADRAVSFPDGRWASFHRRAIDLHSLLEREPSSHVLSMSRDGRFVAAEPLAEPGTFVFVHNDSTNGLVQHINFQTRRTSAALLLPRIDHARVARDRRLAVAWSAAAQRMFLIDLRTTRMLASRELLADLVGLDIDHAGRDLVLQRSGGRLMLISVIRFFASGHLDEPIVAVKAEHWPTLSADSISEPIATQSPLDHDESAEHVVCLAEVPTPHALPRPAISVPSEVAELFLGTAFDLVAAWCQVAIASAWNTGRIAFPKDGIVPYEGEVNALLRQHPPRAPEQLERAEAALHAARDMYDFVMIDAAVVWSDDAPKVIDARDSSEPNTLVPWPMRDLANEFGLEPLACELLLACLAPSARPEFARLFAIVRNDPGRPLCDEMLLYQLLESHVPVMAIAAQLEDGAPLLRHGLLRRGDGERIFAPLHVNPAVMARLRNTEAYPADAVAISLLPDGMWIVADAVPRLLQVLDDAPAPLRLVLRGKRSAGRRTLAALIARASGRVCLDLDLRVISKREVVDWLRDRLVKAAILRRLPCISGMDEVDADGDVRTNLLHVIRQHPGPIVLRAGLDWTTGADMSAMSIDLPRLTETGRREVWRRRLAGFEIDRDEVAILARRHSVGVGAIVSVTERLQRRSAEEVGPLIEARFSEVRESRLGAVATRIRHLPRWDDVVLPEDVWQRIQELMARVKYRRKVYEEWGFEHVATTALGITALFQGGPGTGKTLVAGAIARELDYELYRVDVSKIVSKWIGETEKNLSVVFDSAEDGRLVLLFDEADTLFAKRTEVKSSVDRYANSEVNFLLQRLDSFHGVAILTTNRPGAMDSAFQRRLSMAVPFPDPDDDLRQRIWQVHIPPEVPCAPGLDLTEIAAKHRFSGGHIRNAVMRALFFAASRGESLQQTHLEEAIRLEYHNLGKLAQGGAMES